MSYAAGGLGLSIEGPSKAEIQCKDNKDGTCTISYVPTLPGEYKIVIKYAGQPITDTPYFAKISAPCKYFYRVNRNRNPLLPPNRRV